MRVLTYFLILLSVLVYSISALSIELKELSIDYKNYGMLNDRARDPLIYPEHPKEGINLNINTDIVEPIYWNSIIESTTTGSQYRAIGLQTTFGVRLTDEVNVGWYHHSQHLLDRPHPYMDKFPTQDAIHIKIYLYAPKKREGAMF